MCSIHPCLCHCRCQTVCAQGWSKAAVALSLPGRWRRCLWGRLGSYLVTLRLRHILQDSMHGTPGTQHVSTAVWKLETLSHITTASESLLWDPLQGMAGEPACCTG
jgi:hypothetical protein